MIRGRLEPRDRVMVRISVQSGGYTRSGGRARSSDGSSGALMEIVILVTVSVAMVVDALAEVTVFAGGRCGQGCTVRLRAGLRIFF